jgi:hypothetical protein
MTLATGLGVSSASVAVATSVSVTVPNTEKGDQNAFLGLNTIEVTLPINLGNAYRYTQNTGVAFERAINTIVNQTQGLINAGLTNGLSYVSIPVITDYRSPIVFQANTVSSNYPVTPSTTLNAPNYTYNYGNFSSSPQNATTVVTDFKSSTLLPNTFSSIYSYSANEFGINPQAILSSAGIQSSVVGVSNYGTSANNGLTAYYNSTRIVTDYYSSNTVINMNYGSVMASERANTGNADFRQAMSSAIVAIASNNDINLFINSYSIPFAKPVQTNTITQYEGFDPFNAFAQDNKVTVNTTYYGGQGTVAPSINISQFGNAVAKVQSVVDMPNDQGTNNYPYRPYSISTGSGAAVITNYVIPNGQMISSVAPSTSQFSGIASASITIDDMVYGGSAKPYNIQSGTTVVVANTVSDITNIVSISPQFLVNYLGYDNTKLFSYNDYSSASLIPVKVDITGYSPVTYRYNAGYATTTTNFYSVGGSGGTGGVGAATSYWS